MFVSKEVLTKINQSIDFFKTFTPSELLALVQVAEEEEFEPGATIIEEGDASDKVYIITEGGAQISRRGEGDKPHILCTLAIGECFGEMGLLGEEPRSATALAGAEGVTLLCFSAAVLSERNQGVALKLYRNFAIMLAERLREANDRLDQASS